MTHDLRASDEGRRVLATLVYDTSAQPTPSGIRAVMQQRAYRHRGRYRPGTNLRGWLATILTRLAIDGRRRAAHAPDAASLDEAERACERRAARAGAAPTPVET